jgi:hypothetical protein
MLCRLKDALNTTVDRLGYRGRLRSLAAMQAWNEDIAPCLATESRATFIRGKVLYVTVEKPVWAQQLSMMKQDLIDRVNASAGQGAVTDIRFRTGQIREAFTWGPSAREEAAAGFGQGAAAPVPDWTCVEPDIDTRARARAAALTITDDELRSRFERFMLLDAKYRIWIRHNLSSAAAQAADVLRREPWLCDDHLRSLVPVATMDDLMRARETVAAELCDEVRTRMSAETAVAGAGRDFDVGQRRVELKLLVESMAMLLTGRPPEQVDERLVTYALGEEFASYVRHAE